MDGSAVVVWIIIIGVIAVVVMISNAKARALAKAKKDYQDSLVHLSKDPANAGLKTNTLALGRFYANLTRDKKGVAMFDEVALMNDINAACAAAMHVAPSHHVAAAPMASARMTGSETEQRLVNLANLQAKGLISDSELQNRRNAILDEI
jgi:uncharacterized protein YxeA